MSPNEERPVLSDEEIARLAKTMRVADVTVDNGAFTSLEHIETMAWLFLLGVKEMDPDLQRTSTLSEQAQHELAVKKLRLALWDVQRLDLLFPGHIYSETPNFRLMRLPSWPNWKDAHPELRLDVGTTKLDGYADAERLNSYVMTHFNMMAFTQAENVKGVMMNPRKNITGAWIGSKKIMSHASLDITRDGGKNTPFVTYFSTDQGPGTSMLLMEILDVKQASWPEPDAKFMKELKSAQEAKYGDSADGPLNPMLQTPKIPIVVVRYTYLEGRPPGGSQFMLHLESVMAKTLPPDASAAAVRRALQNHIGAGEEMPEAHVRMFARLLAYNAGLVDREWSRDLQSYWSVSEDVEKETRISFFVPCPRMRFRALEEIETGKSVVPVTDCATCGKPAKKLMCSACKSACYCSTDCSTADWPAHKPTCQTAKKLRTSPASLPPNTLYVPMNAESHYVLDYGFAHPQEEVRMGGAPVGTCPRNEYGAARFVCRATLPRGAGMWNPHEGRVVFSDARRTAYFCDRRRSVQVRTRPEDALFHAAGYAQFVQLMERRGVQGQQLNLWARRVGDCLEVDLKDIPKQEGIRWE